MAYNLCVVFLLIFCFPIPIVGNSAMVALLLALCRIVFIHHGKIVYDYDTVDYFSKMAVNTLALIAFSALITVITEGNDFSRTNGLVSLLIGLALAGIVYVSLDKTTAIPSNKLAETLLTYVFGIQALISILSFLSPSVRELVANFQFSEDAATAESSYAGIRGMALSGRLYFEFSASCGLLMIFQMKRILESSGVGYKSIILLFLIIICGFFAGRTSLIGFAISVIFLLLYKIEKKYKVRVIVKFLLFVAIFIMGVIIILPSEAKFFITEHLLPWVFDLFIKYYETGSTESSASFHSLNEMYSNVTISARDWLSGCGKYTNSDGTYYGHVDAGYLRQILYWGIPGLIISLSYTVLMFARPWKSAKDTWNARLFLFLIFLYTLIVHYKGDILSISRFYYTILFLYLENYIKTKNYELRKL